MSKPWLEMWRSDQEHFHRDCWTESDCQLASTAPDMCRALLAVEWVVHGMACPCCGFVLEEGSDGHLNCDLDAALTKAGLKTQEQRDAARAEIARMK